MPAHRKPIDHGTDRGYRQHLRRPKDEPDHEPCQECKNAWARYIRGYSAKKGRR